MSEVLSLHRASKVPDWELVPSEEHSAWQEFAKRTNGVMTPANAVTLAGLGFTLWGIHDISQSEYLKGTVKIGIGRILDVVDGWVADITETKSEVGEAADAGADKIAIFAGLYYLGENDILSKRFVGATAIQNTLNTTATFIGKARGNPIHPSRTGKSTAVAQWAEIVTECVSETIPDGDAKEIVGTISLGIEAVSYFLGAKATYEYLTQAFGPIPDDQEIDENMVQNI